MMEAQVMIKERSLWFHVKVLGIDGLTLDGESLSLYRLNKERIVILPLLATYYIRRFASEHIFVAVYPAT